LDKILFELCVEYRLQWTLIGQNKFTKFFCRPSIPYFIKILKVVWKMKHVDGWTWFGH